MFSSDLKIALKAALEAGKKIIEFYDKNQFDIELKSDNSPLTLADRSSHNSIVKKLSKTDVPILSEEGAEIDYSIRKRWSKFWLIDPLDGTKEFIKKNGEFTVNIALIENQVPILGVVYAPELKELFFAEKSIGSIKVESIKEFEELKTKDLIELSKIIVPKDYTIVASRSHLNKETIEFIKEKKQNHKNVIIRQFGSSLKICRIAERKAHCYPRLGPTMEWDTAAAHAIVKYSGKKVVNSISKDELTYNKESLLNPFFIVQ